MQKLIVMVAICATILFLRSAGATDTPSEFPTMVVQVNQNSLTNIIKSLGFVDPEMMQKFAALKALDNDPTNTVVKIKLIFIAETGPLLRFGKARFASLRETLSLPAGKEYLSIWIHCNTALYMEGASIQQLQLRFEKDGARSFRFIGDREIIRGQELVALILIDEK